MEIFLIDHWQIISVIIALVFNGGITYNIMKDKPSEKEIIKLIDKKLDAHCLYKDRVIELEVKDKAVVRDIQEIKQKVNTVVINLKGICDELKVPYHTGNGG